MINIHREKLITLAAAAKRTALSIRTIRRAVKKGDLEAMRFGKVYRTSEEAVDRWGEHNESKAREEDELTARQLENDKRLAAFLD